MNSRLLTLLALTLSASVAEAETTPLSEQAAAAQTVQHNPAVRAAVADLRQRRESVRAEAARYRPSLLVEANGTHQNTPNLNTMGGTSVQLSQALVLATQLNQTFSWGTTLSLRFENRISRSEGPLFSGSSDRFSLGPGHLYGARLTVTQPLLRGFGNDVGLADLRTAELDRSEQERARDETASSALSESLQAYWELWYAQRALGIEREARDLALAQRDEMQRKVAAGSEAEVGLLTYETSLAELEQAVLDAEVTVATSTVALRRALGLAAGEFDLSAAEPPEVAQVDGARTLDRAERASYAVAQREIALERAQTSARTAADATRPRLDASGWLQAQGLGNESASDGLNQLTSAPVMSGYLGIALELPLSTQRHAAQRASAESAVSAAEQRLLAARQQVDADARTELTSLAQASTRIELAARTAEVSQRSADAQRKRLDHGVATALEVRQAEDAWRRARLRVERQRIDAVKAQIRLAHLTGDLLASWDARIPADVE